MNAMYDSYLKTGLASLAMTSRRYPGEWFRGHQGAEILALTFLLIDDLVAVDTRALVVDTLEDRLAAETSVEPGDRTASASLDPLLDQLALTIERFSADGHGVIFGVLAVKAFLLAPDSVTTDAVTGVIELLRDADKDNVDRYFGIADYKTLLVEDSYPRFRSLAEGVKASFCQHESVYPDREINGQLYFFAGDQLHLITHAQALYELDKLGYRASAVSGLEALRKHHYLIERRAHPADLQPYTATTVLDPSQPDFWVRGKQDAHQAKLAYAVLAGFDVIPESNQQAVLCNVSKYWELLD